MDGDLFLHRMHDLVPASWPGLHQWILREPPGRGHVFLLHTAPHSCTDWIYWPSSLLQGTWSCLQPDVKPALMFFCLKPAGMRAKTQWQSENKITFLSPCPLVGTNIPGCGGGAEPCLSPSSFGFIFLADPPVLTAADSFAFFLLESSFAFFLLESQADAVSAKPHFFPEPFPYKHSPACSLTPWWYWEMTPPSLPYRAF